MDELEVLRQTAGVREYTSKFQGIIVQLPELDEEYKRYRYLSGLKPEVQAIVEQHLPNTLDHAVELATVADSVAERVRGKKHVERTPAQPGVELRSSRQYARVPSSGVPSVNPAADNKPVPMQLGSMSADSKRCFICQQPGHLARSCPQRQE